MVPFRGLLFFKLYFNKRHKTFQALLRWRLYLQAFLVEKLKHGKNLAKTTVKNLMETLLVKGLVFCDNWYTSLTLAKHKTHDFMNATIPLKNMKVQK